MNRLQELLELQDRLESLYIYLKRQPDAKRIIKTIKVICKLRMHIIHRYSKRNFHVS